ncbi:hypothetical protein GCM10022223_38010 [Kineosporia mesophila]|uniref:Uncharacterized protein n=1 Tax=Kineosporia mesophila TaxID=566012 RepID=A0ABP6ZR96_9ACTN
MTDGKASRRSEGRVDAGAVVWLLVGLADSGETTYDRRHLETSGSVRLPVDELVYA